MILEYTSKILYKKASIFVSNIPNISEIKKRKKTSLNRFIKESKMKLLW